jgi:selenocysteine lyase/cysteine desulfurase
MIYFDNAATTFPKPECVYQALDRANRTLAFNAGHGESQESELALAQVIKAREMVASLVPPATKEMVVFTSSATESLNLIIRGLPLTRGDSVYITPFEHNAIVRPLHLLAKEKGIVVRVLPFQRKGWSLDENKMADMFAVNPPAAVFCSQISNVTGYELPYSLIFKAARKSGGVTILDAAQGFGIFPIKDCLDCSYIVFAGHKTLYASFGVAGFLKMGNDVLNVVKAGGTGSDSLNPEMPESSPTKYESGSLNVVAISSLITSIDWLKKNPVGEHEKALATYFRQSLRTLSNVIVFLPDDVESKGIVSFDIQGYRASDVGSILGDAGFSVRTGFHCAPLVHEFISSLQYSGTVRCSFGAFNTEKQIDALIDKLREL